MQAADIVHFDTQITDQTIFIQENQIKINVFKIHISYAWIWLEILLFYCNSLKKMPFIAFYVLMIDSLNQT